jgi:hypothetical protein
MNPTQGRRPEDVQLRGKLTEWLASLEGGQSGREVGVHLGDLYPACENVMRLTERMLTLSPSAHNHDLRRTMAELSAELFEHILPHLEELRPSLTALVERLYEQADEGGD